MLQNSGQFVFDSFYCSHSLWPLLCYQTTSFSPEESYNKIKNANFKFGFSLFSTLMLETFNPSMEVKHNLQSVEYCKTHDIFLFSGLIVDYYHALGDVHKWRLEKGWMDDSVKLDGGWVDGLADIRRPERTVSVEIFWRTFSQFQNTDRKGCR